LRGVAGDDFDRPAPQTRREAKFSRAKNKFAYVFYQSSWPVFSQKVILGINFFREKFFLRGRKGIEFGRCLWNICFRRWQ
jgi:hypothetical protein